MKERVLYQTLEDRGNISHVEKYGPFSCADENSWLCPGYYFWEAPLEVAQWWGRRSYINNKKGYIVGKTSYDYGADDFFDLAGDTEHRADFWDAYDAIKYEYENKPMTAAMVLGFMREDMEFSEKFKAVRAYPIGSKKDSFKIRFSLDNCAYIEKEAPIQFCVWEDIHTVLLSPFKVIFENPYIRNFKWRF